MSSEHKKKSYKSEGGNGAASSSSSSSNNVYMANQDKPRRLEDETATYLSEIEVQFNAMPSHDLENRSILVNNVLNEIQSRTASAACDRRTNYLLEQLVAHADCLLILQLLQKWTIYIVFLARNRFASHVVQTAISRLCFFLKQGDLGDIDPAFMEETILQLSRPLVHEMFWLGREMSASHVLRSIMCLLAGLPPIAEKKGKNSKHQHSVTLSEPLENMQPEGKFYFGEHKAFHVPDSFKETLLSGVDTLLHKSKRDLQLMIAEISSCAMISILIRILSNPRLFDNAAGVDRCQKLIRHALELESEEQHDSSVFYAMAGDKAGSYFLETAIECMSLDFLLALVQANVTSTAKDYAIDAFGNFILQAICKRMNAEMESSRKDRDRQQMKEITAVGQPLLEELISDNHILELLAKQKGGLVYWLLECSKHMEQEETATHIAFAIMKFWQLSQEANQDLYENVTAIEVNEDVNVDKIAEFLSIKFSTLPTKEDLKKKDPSKKGGDEKDAAPEENIRGVLPDSQQLLIARLLGGLLQSKIADVKAKSAKIMTLLSQPALKVITTSGPMSKAVLDVFFVEFANTAEFKLLGMNLANTGVELAYHFVGQHVVKKIYESSDLRGKERWVQMLSAAKPVLTKTKEGRNAMHYMNVELYDRDAAEWRAAVKKQLKAATLMTEIAAPTPVSKPASTKDDKPKQKKAKTEESTSSSKKEVEIAKVINEEATESKPIVGREDENEEDGEEDENDANGDSANKKRKRKRKRPQNKTANDN